jgi:ABC-type lipoprotein export system ATPase subunit
MSDSGKEREVILDISAFEVHFETRRGIARAVNKVDLKLYKGERFGLVGESGSGKTTMILALLRMIKTPGYIAGGKAVLDDGMDLLALSPEEVRKARLKRVAMVPQGAMNSLNPVVRIADQMILTMREHGEEGDNEAMLQRVTTLFDQVGLKHEVARLYPHELSGGMKQRVCIAQAYFGVGCCSAAPDHADAAPTAAPARRHHIIGWARYGFDGTICRARRHYVRRQAGRGRSGGRDLPQPAAPLYAATNFQYSIF